MKNSHQNESMRFRRAQTMVAFCWGLVLCVCSAQVGPTNSSRPAASGKTKETKPRTLTQDDGLAVISAALDPKVRRYSGHDCSHLVHAVYDRAGFSYVYASSDDLYAGVEGFLRITHPQPGDLIVWHGHVGIVIRPSRHVFFSFLTAGPGIDDYESAYWTSRGSPRFYRYIKNDPCAGCSTVSTSERRRPN